MKKRILSFALALVMLLSMSTVAFAANEWESDIDVVSVANVGDNTYATLEDAFAAANGAAVALSGDLKVSDLVLPAKAVLNLNGYTLTAESIDATAPGASIIDTTGGEGLLVVNGDCEFAENNAQLPLFDEDAAGYRFFNVTVKSVAVTGGTKYWFQVKFENFDKVYALLNAGSDLDIKVNLTCDGEQAVAVAQDGFVMDWAERYNGNDSIYITAALVDAEGFESISAIPAIGANGVEAQGKTM